MLVLLDPKTTGDWGIGQIGEELYAIPPCCTSTANERDDLYHCVSCGKTYPIRNVKGRGLPDYALWATKLSLSKLNDLDELNAWIKAWTGLKVNATVD